MSDSEGSSNGTPVHSPLAEAADPPSEKGSLVNEHEDSRHSVENSSIKSPSASPRSDGEEVKSESNGREEEKVEENGDKTSERDGEGSEKGEADVLSVGDRNEDADESRDDTANQSKNLSEDSDHEEDEAGPSKRRRVVMSSDDEDDGASSHREKGSESGGDQQGEAGVGELMTNIFGEESDDEGGQQEHHQVSAINDDDEDEPRFVREEGGEEDDGKVWDFDEMLSAKKAERRQQRRRRKDGSIDIGNDADEQIRMLAEAMKAAAKDDRHSNMERKPALQKRKMLRFVKAMLIKRDYMEAIIDDGMLSAVSEWLAPLPDKSLPALEIRTDLLKILQDYTRLEQGTLKQCGLGRAVMLLYKHPKETKANKALAHNLISEWARPIFQLETDYHAMTREERMQRDYSQMSEAKRQQMGHHENTDEEKEPEPRVYDKGFVSRARVPRPSKKDYVIRPKSNVEGQFRGATKNRQNSRYDKTQRDFKERTKKSRAQRALGVSIEGRKMDI